LEKLKNDIKKRSIQLNNIKSSVDLSSNRAVHVPKSETADFEHRFPAIPDFDPSTSSSFKSNATPRSRAGSLSNSTISSGTNSDKVSSNASAGPIPPPKKSTRLIASLADNRISCEGLVNLLKQAVSKTGPRVLLFDVRTKEEYLKGHIKWRKFSRTDGKSAGGVIHIEPETLTAG